VHLDFHRKRIAFFLLLLGGGIALVSFVFLVALAVVGVDVDSNQGKYHPAVVAGAFLLLGFAIALLALAFRGNHPWASPFVLLIAGSAILCPPFGTALGIYTYWYFLRTLRESWTSLRQDPPSISG
jgi:hypothetical protein